MRKRIIIGLAVLVVVVILGWFTIGRLDTTDRSQYETQTTTQQTTEKGPETIRFIASGDMIPHDTINLRANEIAAQPYVGYFQEVQAVFDSADLAFCNQEAPSAGEEYGIAGYPSFNAPVAFASGLSTVGCNIINLANNHLADRGSEAVVETLEVWDNLSPYAVAGANRSADEQAEPAFFDYKGVRFAYVAFAEFSNNSAIAPHTVNIFSEELVTSLMSKADDADYVIVSAHWGIEDQEALSEFQKRWGQRLSELGADLIIGTGPHVLQTIDTIERSNGDETLVLYSLGNMLSSQLTLEQRIGAFVVLDFTVKNETLTLQNISALPTYMHYEWTTAEKAAEDLLARRNVKLYPLAQADDPFSRSLLGSSPAEQLGRVENLFNQNQEVDIIKLEQL